MGNSQALIYFLERNLANWKMFYPKKVSVATISSMESSNFGNAVLKNYKIFDSWKINFGILQSFGFKVFIFSLIFALKSAKPVSSHANIDVSDGCWWQRCNIYNHYVLISHRTSNQHFRQRPMDRLSFERPKSSVGANLWTDSTSGGRLMDLEWT